MNKLFQKKNLRILILLILLLGIPLSVFAALTQQRLQKHAAAPDSATITAVKNGNWSDPTTWNLAREPQNQDVVAISGYTVTLDKKTAPLRAVLIGHEGKFTFARQNDVEVIAEYILIEHMGTFEVGTETDPFLHKATITLSGTNADESIVHSHNGANIAMGTKGIMVGGGTLELHGKPKNPSWTKLNATANKGATTLTLAQPVNWEVGDKIIITSTDYDQMHTEEKAIIAVNGNTITLDSPLAWMHYGVIQTYDGKVLDERAEVGLLTHNILIRPLPGSTNGTSAAGAKPGFGGHVMAHTGSTMHVENVEFFNMGQTAVLGRYPIHFHMAGDVSGNYVKTSSLHHLFSRCITLHGVDRWLIQENVCYDTLGHMYFFEDAVEQNNELIGNLGALVRRPSSAQALIPSDIQGTDGPATFWISNPNNKFLGNVAAGSAGNCYWLDPQPAATGPSAGRTTIKPRETPLGEFRDNSAHSCRNNGFFVDPYHPKSDQKITNFTTHHNSEFGIWFTTQYIGYQYSMIMDGGVIADSMSAGRMPGKSRLENVLVVGESANKGNPNPGAQTGEDGRMLSLTHGRDHALLGWEFYDGPAYVLNNTFVNFVSNATRKAGAISWNRALGGGMRPTNMVKGAEFINANRVWHSEQWWGNRNIPVPSPTEWRDNQFHDMDGSVTGIPNSWVTSANPKLLWPDGGTIDKSAEWNAYIQTKQLGADNFGNVKSAPQDFTYPNGVTQADDSPVGSFVPNAETTFGWRGSSPKANFRVDFLYFQPGQWLIYHIPYPYGVTTIKAGGSALPAVASLAALRNSTSNAVYYDPSAQKLSFKVYPIADMYHNEHTEDIDWKAVTIEVTGSGSPQLTPTSTPSTPTPTQTITYTTYNALLSADEEVPPTNSPHSAQGSVKLSSDESHILVSLQLNGLTSNQTAGHIHGPAGIGQEAGPLFTLPNGSFTNERFSVTPTQVQQLKNGQWYFNIHTANFSDGEIRGQIALSGNPSPTLYPTGSPAPTYAGSPSPTSISTTRLNLSLLLHGIGKAGDNAAPGSNGNMNPLTPQRNIRVEIYNGDNTLISQPSGTVNYNSTNGNFTGTVNLENLQSGSYLVRVKSDKYLRRSAAGIVTITENQTSTIPTLTLVTGDSNNDNSINILDYNMILDCYADLSPAKNCDPAKKTATDLTDDGNVNQLDYNLFLRELSVQTGE